MKLFTMKSVSTSRHPLLNRPVGRVAGQKKALGLDLPSTYFPFFPPSPAAELKARTTSAMVLCYVLLMNSHAVE